MTLSRILLIFIAITILTSCGDSELYLNDIYGTNQTSDLVVHVTQEADIPWGVTYEKGPRNPNDILPLGKTITLRFSAAEDGHTLFIPEFGVNMPGLAGQTTQAWIAVRKPIDVIVQCEKHQAEDTGLTLRFE